MTLSSPARFCAAFLVAVLAACGDTPTPAAPPNPAGPPNPVREASVLVAVTPTDFSDVVGSNISQPPAVMARDSNGDPVPGVAVTFAVIAGGGQMHRGGKPATGVVFSNSAGIAEMPGWRLGYVPGKNVVSASSGRVTPVAFTAVTVPSPHYTGQKAFGDDEVGSPGSSVGIRPAVLVADIYGNRLVGVPVMFTVSGGGGSLTGANAVTDSNGIAVVTDWILGPLGRQTVSGTYRSGSNPIVFTALAIDPVDRPCEVPRLLPMTAVSHVDLGTGGCKTSSGRPFDVHSVNVPADGLYSFSLSTDGFDSYLEIFDSTGVRVARNDIRDRGTRNSRIDAFIPKGKYTVLATSISPVTTGSYDVSWTRGAVDGCEVPAIARNVLVQTQVRGCPLGPSGYFADRYRMYLKDGEQVTILLEFRDIYMEPTLKVTNAAGSVFTEASNQYPAAGMVLSFNSPAEGYYSIVVADLPVGFPYSLIVRRSTIVGLNAVLTLGERQDHGVGRDYRRSIQSRRPGAAI